MQLLSRLKQRLAKSAGFTLIEMLVVAPIAVIVIATLISLMVALVGDISVSRERSVSSYGVQDALDRIEQDARIATTYMPTFSIVTSPQGRDGNVAPFTTASGDIIMSQYATTSNPFDPNRQVVYYADQPYACTGSYTLNRPLTVRVVYFTTGTAGSQTLWRRTIVPPYSTTSTDTTHVCSQPWQRDNCPAPVTINSACQAEDEKILDNVSSFTTTYYTTTGATTTDVRNADSIKVSLTQSVPVAGETIATSGVTRASHINVTTDNIPTAPNVYVYNPAINTYNNPVLTTFKWDAVTNAAVYSVRYKVNTGAWQVKPDQTGTQFQVPDARPTDTITIAVAAKNDMGNSTETSITYTKPLWTVANLENDWDCYQPTETSYPCPGYTLTSSGMVLLRGIAKGGVAGTNVFTLPAGLLPRQQQLFPISASDDFGRMDVRQDGTVGFVSGSASIYIAFDNVRFIANGTPGVTWNNATITTANGWANYSGGAGVYGQPSYTIDPSGRVVMVGLLDGNGQTGILTAGSSMLTFNSGYQPPAYGIYPGVSSGGYFYPIQVQSNLNVVIRGMGSATAWNSIGAIYYPSGSTVTQNAITMQNSWVNYGGAYNTAAYAMGSDGVVSIRGLIKLGGTTRYTVIGNIPAGYRPGKEYAFITSGVNTTGGYTNQIFTRIDVQANGNILVENLAGDNMSNAYLSLEGIHYVQEN